MIKLLEDLLRKAKANNQSTVSLTTSEVEQLVQALREKEKPPTATSAFRTTAS